MDITQEYLKSVLHYDPDTGIFTRRSLKGTPAAGKVAGSIQHGYRAIQIDGKKYYAHRLAFLYMTGEFPPLQVDHINGSRSDNRISNLRSVEQSINMQNMKLYSRNSSGVSGVTWHKRHKKWQAHITAFRQEIYLGEFDDWFEAVCKRKSAEVYHGFNENHGNIRQQYSR